MLFGNSGNTVTGGVNSMPFVFLVPVGEVSRLVHVLDDLPPADTRVVSAEGDFAFLSAVRNHAHFSAAEVVVEEVLKPHAFNAEHPPDVAGAFDLLRLHAIV